MYWLSERFDVELEKNFRMRLFDVRESQKTGNWNAKNWVEVR
jgi:hypothetical protein